WTTATHSWTSPCTDARSRGRTRPPGGHNSAPTRGLTAARPLGHQCQRGREGAPSPSGRDLKPDAVTTSPSGPDRQWRGALLNAERSFGRLKGHHQMPLLVAALAECDAPGGRSWRGSDPHEVVGGNGEALAISSLDARVRYTRAKPGHVQWSRSERRSEAREIRWSLPM